MNHETTPMRSDSSMRIGAAQNIKPEPVSRGIRKAFHFIWKKAASLLHLPKQFFRRD